MRFLIRFSMVVAALFAAGCSKDDNPTSPPSQARVMVVQASPDAPAVDLRVDGAVVATALAYPNNSGYLTVTSGTRNLKMNATGTSNTLVEANLALAGGANYTVFACDSVSQISTLLLTDNLASPPSGFAHVRFIHLSPNAPPIDIAVQGGPVLIANKAFKEFTDFTAVPATTYNLEARLAGTGTVVLTLDNVVVQAGKIYTVFAKGFVGGAGAQALGAQIITNN